MHNILTVSLKPALDYGAEVEEVLPDLKLRCVNPTLEPGGGGVNVSRAIALLGGHSTAFVALGGATGNMLAELLADSGVDLYRFKGPGATGQSTAINETSTGRQFRFVLPGGDWQPQDASRALQEIETHLLPDELVVASGRLPRGVPDDFYVQLGRRVKAAGAKMVVDTSGGAQTELMEKGHGLMQVLRMDRHESEILAGQALQSHADAANFAHSIAAKGLAELVIVARGAEGSVFATSERRFHCVSPKGEVISKVGAGDSFVGGLTLGLARGQSYEEAGKLATATAAAAVMTPGSQLCEKATTERLLAGTVLTAL